MSYVIIPSSNINSTSDSAYGIGLLFSKNGVFNVLYSKDEQGLESFKNLLLTFPGERTGKWMNFGCNLKALLFEQVTDDIKIDINDTIIDAASVWVPFINILSIDIVTAIDDPTLDHSIKVLITFNVESSLLQQTIEINASETGVITIG
jgi:phage baseplate assembly protein W